MKKSVVILIALVYVASIALVSFFGLQFKVFNEEVYVDGIAVQNEGQKANDTFGSYVTVSLSQNNTYVIDTRISPDNATNKKINYTAEPSIEGCASVDENGVVTLNQSGTFVKIMMTPADGSDVQTSLTIVIMP